MAKKKKNKKVKKTMINMVKFDAVEPVDLLMMPLTIYNNGDTHKCDKIANSNVFDDIVNNLPKSMDTGNKIKMAKVLLGDEKELSAVVNDATRMYIRSHECDQGLCLFNENSNRNAVCDILDFTEYDKDKSNRDILKSTITALNEMHIDPTDISLLWSTNEYIRIKYTPSIEFALKRMGYNAEKKCIDYMIIVYNHRNFLKNNIVTIPNTIATISVDFVAAEDMLNYKSDNKELDDINEASLFSYKTSLLSGIVAADADDTHKYIYPRIRVTSVSNENTIDTFIHKIQNIFKQTEFYVEQKKCNTFRLIYSYMLHDTQCDAKTGNMIQYQLTCQNLSIAIACIILTNIILQTKALSLPDKPSKATIIHTAMKTDAQPDRKTRHIGGITITSAKRPSKPTMQKIIRYSMSEWSRRGFMRHYKSGKIVFIEPTTVHRKCVEINGEKKAKTPTKYIVHAMDETKGQTT